ncbi:hypothetical protein GCM10023238_36250 [Streptomyces heliomycini]
MSLIQVPEARKVLRQWARAKKFEEPRDVLRWRQRTGFRDSWMVSSEEDRRVILHRLMCCMWNGQVDVLDGGPVVAGADPAEAVPRAGGERPRRPAEAGRLSPAGCRAGRSCCGRTSAGRSSTTAGPSRTTAVS